MLSALIVILVTLILSAFFSGMEIAFTSSNKLKLEIEKKQSRSYNYILDVFLKNPGQYITTILVGNNIALVLYSLNMSLLLNLIAQYYGISLGGSYSFIFETIVSTIIIIFAAEFVPKAVVRNNPNFFMKMFAVPVYLFYLVLYPIAKFATGLSFLLLRLVGLKVKSDHNIRDFDRVDLSNLIEEAKEHEQTDERNEKEIKLFKNAMDFSELRVRDCMVPRIEIEAVNILDTIEHLSERFVETDYSRIFVYDGSIDNIIGYVNTKSLFTMPDTIMEVMMKVDYVPESLSAQKLLTMFTKKNRTVAVVIDEFGGTAGIVSMEDILEEIFGEIEDEHDSPDMVEKITPDGDYILSGRLEVDYLNEKYALGIPESDEYDTLAGYIIYLHEGIPSQGDVLVLDNKEIRILRENGSKLDLVRVKLL